MSEKKELTERDRLKLAEKCTILLYVADYPGLTL